MNYKTIGDQLTIAEFNAIQYLLNRNSSETITVQIGETITTEYGTIKTTFGSKHYKRKNGFITNSLKMKVIDPVFENMDFEITLAYKTVNDDLLDHDDTNETTITYNIPVDEDVIISEATLDHIINNNAELRITLNKPLIQKAKNIILNGNEFWIENEETLNVTATILANTSPIPGAKVSFSTEGTSTTETTNNQGIATYTYTGEKAGKLDYTVGYEGLNKTFTIYDSFFHNGKFFNASNRIVITENTDDTITLYNPESSSGIGYYLADETGTATSYAQCLQYNAPFTVLYDIVEYSGTCYLTTYDGTNHLQPKLRVFELPGKAFTLRVDVYEDRVEYFVNGEKREDLTWIGTMGTCRAGLRVDKGSTLIYKNVYLSDITSTPITPVDTVTLSANPSAITIGGSTSLTATVTLEDETPGIGRSVRFYDGETLLGSSVTDSNGIAVYTYTPGSVGSLSCTAVCDSVTSSSVTVTVNKITPTLSLASDKQTPLIDEAYVLSGVLSAGSGKTVKIYEGETLLDTVTTSAGGAYSKSVTKSVTGSYTYTTVFEGDSTYNNVTSSSVTVVVEDGQTPTPASITVASNKDILSYYDEDTATITATVLDAHNIPCPDETVTFTFKHGNTTIETQTADTDSSGVASVSYSSKGAGDLNINCSVGSLVSETYVEDCTAYVTSYTDWTDISNKGTDYKFSPFTLPVNHSIEMKFNSTTATRIALGDTSHFNSSGYLEWIYAWYLDSRYCYTRSSSNSEVSNSNSPTSTISTSNIYRLEYEGTSLRLYVNDNLNKTLTSYDTLGLTRLLRVNTNTVQYIEYIKIKPL